MPDPIKIPKLQPVKVPEPPAKPTPVQIRERSLYKPEAVLVSGTAFPREKGEKMRDVFSHYCERMAARLNDEFPGIKITVFNFFEGTQELYEFDGILLKRTVLNTWDKFKLRNYRYMVRVPASPFSYYEHHKTRPSPEAEYVYLLGISELFPTEAVVEDETYEAAVDKGKFKENSLSIGDVYRYISQVGKAWRERTGDYRITQLHFFSRGTARFGEPNLVNARRSASDDKLIDKDGHCIDFIRSVDRPHFVDAFAHPQGYVMCWGSCNDEELQAKILSVVRSKDYEAGLKDPDTELFPIPPVGAPTSLNELLEDNVKRALGRNYTARFARRASIVGYGAPPGVDVNLDDEHAQRRHGIPLMHVFMGSRYGDSPQLDYRDVLKFYEQAVGLSFWDADGEYHPDYGRGYVDLPARLVKETSP